MFLSLDKNVFRRSNDALRDNPPAGDRHITTHASDWLWAVFALMLASFLCFFLWTSLSRRRNRILHNVPVIILAVASLAYFSMASDLGFTVIQSEFGSQPTRQIWYVRYIQWFINAPLELLLLLSLTGMSTGDILTTMFFSWFLVVSGLVGALVHSSYKWGYYVFGLFGLFYIIFRLLGEAPMWSFRNPNFSRPYFFGAGWICFIWFLYPIAWGLSEGGDVITSTAEMVFYGILDLMSGPVFLFFYMWFISQYDFEALEVTTLYAVDRGVNGDGLGGKSARPLAGATGTNGAP